MIRFTQSGLERCMLAALYAALLCLTPVLAPAQGSFTPNESQVTPRVDLFDPEYNQKRAKIAWVDASGNLWVAAVDRSTGLFKPSNGKGVLVDPDALTSADLKLIGNGPEWLLSAGADRLVYTKFLPGLPHRLENARLAMAEQNRTTGQWSVRFLSDLPRYRPYTSADPNDPAPRISYLDPDGNPYWREVDNPATETIVPWMSAPRALAMRFVSGERASVFVSDINGASQVVRYWLDTQRLEQLTFDGGQETTSSPFIWKAPELGDDEVLVVTANRATEVRIYRQLDKSRPEWTVIHSARAPVPGTKLSSAEPFVFNGKSYVFMSGVVPPNDFASTIFLSGIDAANPMFRQLTPDMPLRTRTDPEVFATTTGPYIYFYRADRSSTAPCPCYEGIYRTDTGLRAP
jgi:hypothetical protein